MSGLHPSDHCYIRFDQKADSLQPWFNHLTPTLLQGSLRWCFNADDGHFVPEHSVGLDCNFELHAVQQLNHLRRVRRQWALGRNRLPYFPGNKRINSGMNDIKCQSGLLHHARNHECF